MENETLMPIDGKDTYGITKTGKIWSYPCDDLYNSHNGKWIKQSNDKDGYKIVNLRRLTGKKNKRVHRLVAELFIDNPENKPHVNHIDGDKQNNNVDNLEWVTNQENIDHAIKIGKSNRGTMHKRNTSGYIGVSKKLKKWVGSITIDGVVTHVGSFDNKIDAAIAYDEASIKYHGNTGKQNFNFQIYRKILQNNHISENDIQLIQKKAIQYKGVEIVNKMIINNSGRSQATPSYDLNDLIIAQAEFTENCVPHAKRRNKELLATLRKLRDDLIKEELEFKKVQGVRNV